MPLILKLKLEKLFFSIMTAETYKFEALSKDQSSWRAAQDSAKLKHRDLFSALLEARDPETGQGYTQETLIAEAGLLIVAGSDTMATAITSTIFYLLHYPATLTLLQKEVRAMFKDVEDIKTGAQLSNCTYTVACLNEAMRMTPGVGGLLPREVLSEGMNVDGYHFPAGIDIGVPHYSIHHNAEYYPEPFVFKPERWFVNGDTTESDVALAQSAFCPFNVGRASCIGKSMTYSEMSIVLARVIWLYDMRLKPGSTPGEGNPSFVDGRRLKNEFQVYDNFTSTHTGPLVDFRRAQN